MYNTVKPYSKYIISLIKKTWETPYVSYKDGLLFKKFNLPEYHHTDGIGSKGIYHWHQKSFRNAVMDAWCMNTNDLAMMRAKPYAVVDHLFLPEDSEVSILKIIRNLVDISKKNDVAITGGETSIHNNIDGLDISLTMLGFVEKRKCNMFQENDALLGIKSNGLHSNGFTKVRELFSEFRKEFIRPTLDYSKVLFELGKKVDIHGMQHITGGAFVKLRSILPKNLGLIIGNGYGIKPAEIFYELSNYLSDNEMYKTFNCGVGFIIGIDKEDVNGALNFIRKYFDADVIGKVVKGGNAVNIKSKFTGKEFIL